MEKVFNDAVHGPIRFHPLIVKIIDTPEFQRLRNIKQLGVTYHVFPSACHNRFEHSLGVCHLAGQMVNALRNNYEKVESSIKLKSDKNVITDTDKLCVEIAGLCHDLGHGPFSHLWELFLYECGIKWEHEKMSTELFDMLVKNNGLTKEMEFYGIDEERRTLIKEFILGDGKILPKEKRFLYQIVANKDNDIDVDKWDYFLRDGHQLNVKISFDYRRLLQFCCVVKHPFKKSHHVIGYRDKEAQNLHDMFRVRSDLHHRAYQHPVVKKYELMYLDTFHAANKSYKFRALKNSGGLSDAHKNLELFWRFTDYMFTDIENNPSPDLMEAHEMIDRIHKRKLYTLINKYYTIIKKRCKDVSARKINEKLSSIFKNEFKHNLRFASMKFEYNRHVESLKQVVVFDKYFETTSQVDVTKLVGQLPLEDKFEDSTSLNIFVFSTAHKLDEAVRKSIDDKVGPVIKNLDEYLKKESLSDLITDNLMLNGIGENKADIMAG